MSLSLLQLMTRCLWEGALASSLIDELQLDASNEAVSVSTLLRKALVVASKLEVSDIPEWINSELSGYGLTGRVPPYRIVHGSLKARTIRGWIPVQLETSDLQKMVTEQHIGHSISELEALCEGEGTPKISLAPEEQSVLQGLSGHQTEFACFIEKSRLIGILGAARDQVLRWAIALDKAGVRGDGLSFTGAEKEKAHGTVFNAENLTIGVYGNVGGQANVAAGFQPHAGTKINAGDVQKLIGEIEPHVTGLQLSPTDKQGLVDALAELQSAKSAKPIEAGKVRKVLNRALNFIGKAGETIVTAGIKTYVEGWMKQHGIVP
jgi:AbiTii